MDPVTDIKARLPIEDLVRQYCQLKKSGRNYKCLCPFHKDKNPSLLVSPDKGIAYCFSCQTGGDIFSFYQAIEGVDFPQALKELGERTGVKVQEKGPVHTKDEKERVRSCLVDACVLYQEQLKASQEVREYLEKRGVTEREMNVFQLGFAEKDMTNTYNVLLKKGHSRNEILAAGLGLQHELDGKVHDRFRNRLMFPIHDHQGRLIGFGGRTMGNDNAKYMNSPEGILYHKSTVFFGLDKAKDAARDTKEFIVVEGYFDVLACHRIGLKHTIACCGTALTEEHAHILKRYVDQVTLCLDQDTAGKQAAERAFCVLAAEGLHVNMVTLSEKDPADLVLEDADALKKSITEERIPYIHHVCDEMQRMDLQNPLLKKQMLARLLTLLTAIPTSVERHHYIGLAAKALGTVESALEQDLAHAKSQTYVQMRKEESAPSAKSAVQTFSPAEIALAICILHPIARQQLHKLVPPEEPFAKTLFDALKTVESDDHIIDIGTLDVPKDVRERLTILLLFCEEHDFQEWSQGVTEREFAKNSVQANRMLIRVKQKQITEKLILARQEGKIDEQKELQKEYQAILVLSKGLL
ncbi:DNA primase [Candidatus Peregrinibacteria bacterium CG10_big_fil_rev_8_21_14_0_10_49_16]|nr:MAG: DNA primase [Candidatus Peregrinibacteria bacterium CG22_combo_CG10-13_8_21_14_all_49_11]PIR52287.1 MAG: DNA primase [Candidatus Peregrinibacteria bacterium CG10_big_fil_rev_8_21_14_0_10_49_16]